MRYPDGGGLTAAGRAKRESVRLQAVQMFEHDVGAVQVARRPALIDAFLAQTGLSPEPEPP